MKICMLVSTLALSFASQAAFTEVSDQQLEQMRGKYVAPGAVVYFGIAMDTQWRDVSGQLHRSGVDISLNQSGQFNVTLHSTFSLYATNANAPASLAQNNDGLTQVIVLSGNANDMHNRLDLSVSASADNGNGSSPLPGQKMAGQQGNASTYIHTGSQGVLVGIFTADGNYAMQGIGPQGVYQEINSHGSGLAAINNLQMEITTASSTFNASQVLAQLDLLTGI